MSTKGTLGLDSDRILSPWNCIELRHIGYSDCGCSNSVLFGILGCVRLVSQRFDRIPKGLLCPRLFQLWNVSIVQQARILVAIFSKNVAKYIMSHLFCDFTFPNFFNILFCQLCRCIACSHFSILSILCLHGDLLCTWYCNAFLFL